MTSLALKKQLVFYKLYHTNKLNVLVHCIFVPLILFSTLCILNDVKLYVVSYNASDLLALILATTYVLLHFKVGLLASCMLGVLTYLLRANKMIISQKTAWSIFVLSWIAQFLGHGVFEKRKPALLDSLFQSLVIAPFFILFEYLFILGFLPDLNKEIQMFVTETIKGSKHAQDRSKPKSN
ncbi:HGL084Cp [Eremothecium sinecaudum]|uniref:HGL084Cp n=1 Tax=Eremothecium sinecaudum TaxID=45286 RepID=A0A0X8HV13_9SACH|nr:HGL084Cp [Eremothecium sinecaudum]AMD22256.1 HGL084Cp [Eremothecium sinecaudum]